MGSPLCITHSRSSLQGEGLNVARAIFLEVFGRAKPGGLGPAVSHIRSLNGALLTSSHHNSPSMSFSKSVFPSIVLQQLLGHYCLHSQPRRQPWPFSVNRWMGFKRQNRINICFPLPSAPIPMHTLQSDVFLPMSIDSGMEGGRIPERFSCCLVP